MQAMGGLGPGSEAKNPQPSFEVVSGGLYVLGGRAEDRGASSDFVCALFVVGLVVIGVAVFLVYFVRALNSLPSDMMDEEATTRTTRLYVLSTTPEEYTEFKRFALDKNYGRPRERTVVTVPEMDEGEVYGKKTRSTGSKSRNGQRRFKILHVTTTTSAGGVSLSNYTAHSVEAP